MRAPATTLTIVSLLLFTACGGAGVPAPAGLAYGLPTTTTATYVTADTVVVDMNAMGQMMQVNQASSATYSASFARASDGVEVTFTVEDFSARLSQPMGGPVTANQDGIDGPLVLTLGRRGNVTISSLPELSGGAAQLFAPLSTAHTFFPGLPGTAVGLGDSWTDTTSWEGEDGPGSVAATVVATYTVAGDTVVDGRTLLKIDLTGTSTSESNVASDQGMDILQSTTAEHEGYVLWDTQSGLLYETYTSTEGSGSVEVSIAPEPFPITVRGHSRSKLRN